MTFPPFQTDFKTQCLMQRPFIRQYQAIAYCGHMYVNEFLLIYIHVGLNILIPTVAVIKTPCLNFPHLIMLNLSISKWL